MNPHPSKNSQWIWRIPAISFLCLATSAVQAQDFLVLHSFATAQGGVPNGSLTVSGSTLYGTARRGGANNAGSVYALSVDGSNFQTLYSFAGGVSNGYAPYGGVVISGFKLFGTTFGGGAKNAGTIFSLDTGGSGFQILHSFGGANDASGPLNSLILVGNVLYGTTWEDAIINGRGTVFSINTDGTGYRVIHTFAAGEGSECRTALTLSGVKLFGDTNSGGANGVGTIFCLNLDGSGFQTVYSFAATGNILPNDLTISGSKIYGTAYGGGPTAKGFVFSLDTNGSNFQMLHAFSGSDGQNPEGGLILIGSKLYEQPLGESHRPRTERSSHLTPMALLS